MVSRIWFLVGGCFSFTLGLTNISAAQPINPQVAPQTQTQRESAWLTEAWIDDNAQWQRLRQALEKDVSQTKNRGQLLQRLKVEAQQKPQDAIKQYSWGYAIYRAAVDGSASAESAIPAVARALAATPTPSVYEWTRLRFLVEAKIFPRRRLLALGSRLAQRDPNDYSVKYRLVKILDPGLSPREEKQALSQAHDLIRLQPKRASAHAALASVYLRLWLLKHKVQDGQSAIASYNRYLQLAPKTDSFRPQAQGFITMIQAKK